jgi:hypothetical protein
MKLVQITPSHNRETKGKLETHNELRAGAYDKIVEMRIRRRFSQEGITQDRYRIHQRT